MGPGAGVGASASAGCDVEGVVRRLAPLIGVAGAAETVAQLARWGMAVKMVEEG